MAGAMTPLYTLYRVRDEPCKYELRLSTGPHSFTKIAAMWRHAKDLWTVVVTLRHSDIQYLCRSRIEARSWAIARYEEEQARKAAE